VIHLPVKSTRIDRLTPDSRQKHTALDTIIASFTSLATRLATVRTFNLFSFTNGAHVQSSVTDLGYYIRIDLLLIHTYTHILHTYIHTMHTPTGGT
jgi:hypothetical protein